MRGNGSHRLPDAAELQEVTHDADAVIVQERRRGTARRLSVSFATP